jgi:hypothetical protein
MLSPSTQKKEPERPEGFASTAAEILERIDRGIRLAWVRFDSDGQADRITLVC